MAGQKLNGKCEKAEQKKMQDGRAEFKQKM
jgi:hypothetical protein